MIAPMKLPLFTLIGAGLMMLIPGLLYLFDPQMMVEAAGMRLQTVNEIHVIRTAYGGAFLGVAALFLLGVWRPAQRQASLLAVVLLLSGFAFGRLVSVVQEGVPAPLYVGILLAELLFAGLAVLSLRR